jgi:hypothetical protein
MKRVTLIATAMVLAVLVGMSVRVAAQNTVPSERTIMTFSNTVEMPGVTLPAGTYVFRLADTPTRNVVQVLSGDEKDILGQWTFVQAERPRVSEDTVVMFKESPEGTMPAIQYWYYPGERIGKEFIYPKDQAQKIANRTGATVLSDEGRIASTVTSTDSQGQVTEWKRDTNVETQANAADADSTLRDAPAPAQPTAAAGSLAGNRGVTPSSEPARESVTADVNARSDIGAQSETRPVGTSGVAQSTQAESTQARAELPRTASPAPLAGLIGLLALAGAFGARRLASVRG